MSKHSLIAKLTCTEGKAEEFEAELATLIEASNEEAGLEIYSVHRDADDVAVAAHGKGDAMKQAMAATGAFLAAPPEIHRLTPVTAKGLDI